jgi:hypothetical protein
MRKTPLQDGDRLRLQAGVAMNLGLLAVEAACDQAVMSVASPLQTNLENTIHWQARLPRCEIL